MRLEGKAAIVTGASRGLGRAIALAFAREGSDLLVNYASREEQAGEVASAIEGMGRHAIVHQAGILSGPAYCASKAGVLGLTKCLARAFASHNVQVNAISPAMIDTEILYWRTPAQWKETLESIPLKRLGHPDDLAEAAVFLASSGGNFVTGATIDVNGGLYMA